MKLLLNPRSLGSESIHIRLGGIYSLEKLIKDSPEDSWTVMEILTAFIREKSPYDRSMRREQEKNGKIFERISIDAQAALTVIGRRKVYKTEDSGVERLNLSETNLSRADLKRVRLSGSDLSYTNLQGADLEDADLGNANLYGANLTRAEATRVNLSNANLRGANLLQADLTGADLRNVLMTEVCEIENGLFCDTLLPKQVNFDPNRDCDLIEYALYPHGRD